MKLPAGKLSSILADLLYAEPRPHLDGVNGGLVRANEFDQRVRKIGRQLNQNKSPSKCYQGQTGTVLVLRIVKVDSDLVETKMLKTVENILTAQPTTERFVSAAETLPAKPGLAINSTVERVLEPGILGRLAARKLLCQVGGA